MSSFCFVLELEYLIPAHMTSRSLTRSVGICTLPSVSCKAALLTQACLAIHCCAYFRSLFNLRTTFTATSVPSLTHLATQADSTVKRWLTFSCDFTPLCTHTISGIQGFSPPAPYPCLPQRTPAPNMVIWHPHVDIASGVEKTEASAANAFPGGTVDSVIGFA